MALHRTRWKHQFYDADQMNEEIFNGKLMEFRGNADGIDVQQGLYTKEMEPDHAESVNATNKGITIDPGHSNRDKDTAGEEGEGFRGAERPGDLRASPGSPIFVGVEEEEFGVVTSPEVPK